MAGHKEKRPLREKAATGGTFVQTDKGHLKRFSLGLTLLSQRLCLACSTELQRLIGQLHRFQSMLDLMGNNSQDESDKCKL